MKTLRALIATAAALLTMAFGVAGCRHTGNGDDVIHLNGRIESTTVDLGPKVAGRVLDVRVKAGNRVKAGDLLVTLDLGETSLAVDRERAGVQSAEARVDDLEAGNRSAEIAAAGAEVGERRAAVDLAEKENEREQALFEKNVGTQRDADRAHSELLRARAALKAAEERFVLVREGFRRNQTAVAKADAARANAMLKQSEIVAREREIRAPADGIIVHRLAEPGQLLGAGQSAITMAFADRLFVRTFIPEENLGKVKMGAAARVSVDAFPDRSFGARITEISPESEFTPKAVETRAERVNLVYAAKADLDRGWSEPLVPGQPAEIYVRTR